MTTHVKSLASAFARRLAPMLGGAAALAMIFFLYRDLDLGRFLTGLGEANPFWVAALALAILLEQLVNGWKWRQILHDLKPIPTFRLTGALLAGYGANMLVPLGVSPLVRSWLIARLEGLMTATVLSTTVVARFLDGVVFALFAGLMVAAGGAPRVEGALELGLGVAATLNLALFGGLLWAMFRFRALFAGESGLPVRLFDWMAPWLRADGPALRRALCAGVVWPRERRRRAAAVLAAVAGKIVAATHYLWAGLAAGVVLAPLDYLFLMVFAGFAMVLSRFVRVPGGFVIGSAFAFRLLNVPDEQALLMILFNHVMSIALVVGIGLAILWRSRIDIRRARAAASAGGAAA